MPSALGERFAREVRVGEHDVVAVTHAREQSQEIGRKQ
jgi:hypothetical protein